MKARASAILAAALLTVSGCGDDKSDTQKSGSANLPPSTGTVPIPPAPAHPTAGRVPKVIGQTESAAEDLIDLARAKKRAKVVSTALELRDLAQGGARKALEKDKIPEPLIDALKDRTQTVAQVAGSAPFLELSLAANQVSGLMPDVYAYYTDPVPPAVLKLDYLDREAQLRSKANDLALTQRASGKLASTWNGLRPQVLKAGGDKEAALYTRHVVALRKLVEDFDRPAIQKEAAKGLQLVDDLESVFRQQ
jgi:hypothetical protein